MLNNDYVNLSLLYEKIITEKTDDNMHNRIIEFIEQYDGSGFGGDCGIFAIKLNKFLGNIGEYYAAINPQIWALGEYWLGHVGLMIDGSLYDADGEVDDLERFKSWGQVDEDGNEAELYNLTPDECYESEVINISDLWGGEVENNIIENTKCDYD